MARGSPRGNAVWDPLVRIVHWSLAAGVALAWLTREGGAGRHEWIGYATLALVGVRFLWGFAGPRRARFADFVRSPRATLAYARRVIRHDEPRHVGHNPLGGWMVVALLLAVAVAGITGWLYTTDRFWGLEWMARLHEGSAIAVLALVAVHVAGVVHASRRHRENLVAAMIHGRKRAAAAEDVD